MGNTSSIRVHVPASYVSLPECNQLRLVVYPIIYDGFLSIPGGDRQISEPSAVVSLVVSTRKLDKQFTSSVCFLLGENKRILGNHQVVGWFHIYTYFFSNSNLQPTNDKKHEILTGS